MVRIRSGRKPVPESGIVRKGVQFDIDVELWNKFKFIAARDGVSVAELMTECVSGICAQEYTPLDGERRWPFLIGGAAHK